MDNLSQNQRLIIASILSMLVLILWQEFFAPMPPAAVEQSDGNRAQQTADVVGIEALQEETRQDVIEDGFENDRRIKIGNDAIFGSINLKGARIDDISLADYKETQEQDSDNVVLLSPSEAKDSYFITFGWVKSSQDLELPDSKTVWKADKRTLKANDKIRLTWVNKQGVEFFINMALDEKYMFTVTQGLNNKSSNKIKVGNFAVINRQKPELKDNVVIHQGGIGSFDKVLEEVDYDDLVKEGKITYENKSGWIGFSDKYWLTALIHKKDNKAHYNSKFAYSGSASKHRVQADTLGDIITLNAGQSYSDEFMVFVGAKQLELLDEYENKYSIYLFDRAVDFGILYFITKPIFEFLHHCYEFVGNFGVAILLLTIIIKGLLFPLAHKGYRGMNRLKDLQPKMTELKERYVDDSQTFQKELMALYKKEKVNPMAGCLPLLLQMPIFFALYKVLYVTIEMRHAPFFGWLQDLSVQDPTSIFNLFGLLPFTPPSFLMIGVLPILMALTMFIQQKLNPEPTDPVQAKVMKFLPVMFLFMFASFPSGLVLYWSWSNVLSILQQLLIKKIEKK